MTLESYLWHRRWRRGRKKKKGEGDVYAITGFVVVVVVGVVVGAVAVVRSKVVECSG